MQSFISKILLITALVMGAPAAVRAGSLQVEPVLVDVIAPGAASTLTLRNQGPAPIDAQIRVYRWSLVNGEEKLDPTDDVVASPPATSLAPKAEYITRIVRVSKSPLRGEESYRLLVDQLPDLTQQKNGTVNLLVRYSIPVFFGAADKKSPAVAWSLTKKGDKVTLIAHNSGDRRLRISALNVRDARGKTISFGAGLAGYALGQSAKHWTSSAPGFAVTGPTTISAQSDAGPISAVASIAGR